MFMEIPVGVRELLWEYAIDGPTIDDRWQPAVLERVMQRGGWAEMRWLLKTFSRTRIRSFLEDRGHRVLAPRELRFWAFVSGVDAEVQDDWVRMARQRQREWRG
jgi:hypothetical protein